MEAIDTSTPLKYDGGKIRLELIPPEFLWWTGEGLTYGADKYTIKDPVTGEIISLGAGNWARGEGFEWSRLYGGLQRHLNAWAGGEDFDVGPNGSGNHHLKHACCMLSFLVAHVAREHGKDDRIDVGIKPRVLQ